MADATSPLEEAVSRVGDRWTLLVIDALLDGPRRFGELEDGVPGVSTNVLADRLRRLEASGLVVARPYSERPPRFAYQLTAPGTDLAGALRALAAWGARRAGGDEAAAGPLHHAACGSSLDARWHCATCDRLVEDGEIDELRWA